MAGVTYFPDSHILDPPPPAWSHLSHRDKPLWYGPRFGQSVAGVPHLVPPQKSLMSKRSTATTEYSRAYGRPQVRERLLPWDTDAPVQVHRPAYPSSRIGPVFVHDAPTEFPYATPKRIRRTPGPNVGWMGSGKDPSTAEKKFHDFAFTSNNTSVSGQIIASLNLVAQGTTEVTRIGRSINISAIQMRYQLNMQENTDADRVSDTVRVMLIQDRQANAAAPAVLDVLETATILSYNNLANRGRFVTLFDRFHDCNAVAGSSPNFGEYIQTFDYYSSVDVPVQFDGVTGAIGEILSSNIFMLLISTSARVLGSYSIRIRFTD